MIEYIFSLVICGIVALILILIGIGQIKSKAPVGFYTHEQAPRKQDIKDIETWNKKHGWIWIVYGTVLIGGHLLCFLIENVIWASVLLIGVYIVPLPIAMWYHTQLKKKYYR